MHSLYLYTMALYIHVNSEKYNYFEIFPLLYQNVSTQINYTFKKTKAGLKSNLLTRDFVL